jgi:hydroxymethylpyrimidine/phosphomethylpyrimidine kinase
MKNVLTIAGSDPSGGAGVQADLKVFADAGVFGFSAVTAVTAQNSLGVQKINKVPPRIVAAQIDSVARDFTIDACKIGMIYAYQTVDTIAERIKRRDIHNVVLDPVTHAKDATRLLQERGIGRMKRVLLPLCLLVTPNLDEASELTGQSVTDIASAKEAAKAIFGFGTKYVLVKGGHLADEPIDILFDGESFIEFSGKRVEGKSMHGTGCILSAAVAARIAIGDSVPKAVEFAKDYVVRAMKNSLELGKGHLWYFAGNGVD